MKTIQDVKIGEQWQHPEKGLGEIIAKTKRTITVKYPKSTCKNSYRHNDARFSWSDF